MKTLFTLGLAAAGLAMMAPSANAAEVGEMAPEIRTTDINGNDFNLSDHKGDIVVLEWTNHQCPYVVKHYDSGNMQKLQKDVTAMDGVKWVSIISSAEGKQGNITAEEAKAIIEEKGAAPTAQLLDPSGKIGNAYNAQTTPHMYVIDADGKIAYMGAIDDDSSPRQSAIEGSKNYVMAAVKDLKDGKPVAVSSTQPYGCSVKY